MSPQGFPFFRIAACTAALVGLAGCPQGGDLENPEDYVIPIATGGTGNPGSGGSSTAGTSTAGTSTGGTGTGLVVNCDYQTALSKNCAITVCHGTRNPLGALNLTPDDSLVMRLKDVVATNEDLDCDPSAQFLECTDVPPECSSFAQAKLVDSANPDASFILTKLSASGCGNQMPMAPGDSASYGWSAEREACIRELVHAIAAL